jgi:hypothetical protein
MLKIGKLYSCSGYFLLLFPDRETAVAVAADVLAASTTPAFTWFCVQFDEVAAYWSKRLRKPVSYCEPLTPLLILSVNEKYHEVLAGDQKGWIIYHNWLEIKEIVDEAA